MSGERVGERAEGARAQPAAGRCQPRPHPFPAHASPAHPLRPPSRRSPALDVRYIIFASRKAAEEMSGGDGNMSALSRVAFEKHLSDAREAVIAAIAQQVAFWGELQGE